jgi:hypothetical protein
MRPATLAETIERIRAGEASEQALPEFLDEFYLASAPERQFAMLASEPALTGEPRLDALAGAVAEYLARQYGLPDVPSWCFGPQRYLDRAWHASPFADDGFREYLTFASPAEFSSRNIFTEERPLRRARSGLGRRGIAQERSTGS